ncbi:hypothetical protein DFS34DRAFT_415627 [Phlyctochytrium arcticum]|nr:hypothetical protein DFS34DRAFT_415627 [Phlyctochytrium arcticum]
MSIITGLIGVFIIILTLHDVFYTTLSIHRTGPLTKLLTRAMTGLSHMVNRFCRWRLLAHHLMRVFGLLTLVLTIIMWFILLWMGFSFLFTWQENAILNDADGRNATVGEVIYFTGFCLFTVGMGDFRPNPDILIFQLLTDVCAGIGYLMVSLASTYVFLAVEASSSSRALATKLSWMGGTPKDILKASWDGETFKGLDMLLVGQLQALCGEAQKHNVYPLLFNIHNLEDMSFAPPRIAALDEVLTILFWGVPPEKRPDQLTLVAMRNAITLSLDSFCRLNVLKRKAKEPPLPDMEEYAALGLPVVSNEAFQNSIARNRSLADRRAKLRVMIEVAGRCWDDVTTYHQTDEHGRIQSYPTEKNSVRGPTTTKDTQGSNFISRLFLKFYFNKPPKVDLMEEVVMTTAPTRAMEEQQQVGSNISRALP